MTRTEPSPPPDTSRERILDELLVLRVQEGSRKAFEALATRWQERLWRHAFRLTGLDSAAWDVVQETWVAVASGIGKLKDAGAFRCWIYTIATRCATDRLRRLGREEITPPEAMDARSSADGELSDRDQAVAQLRSALRELPGDARALVSLRYFEEFALWEIARILDVPEGTVKSRLHHARNQLRDILERKER